jgi:coenzyme F420-0:L-glutamate ligase / coenzyme F420-1:gamma-L-glutamate ligase
MDEARVGTKLEIEALLGLPLIRPGDSIAALIGSAIEETEFDLRDDDVLVVTSKLFSRAEGRFVDLTALTPSAEAIAIAREIEKDPALVECVLRESTCVSRKAKGVLITRHRLGFISANAGIDASNAGPPSASAGTGPGTGSWVLLLPVDPEASAERLRFELESRFSVRIGVVVSDSHGRPFRHGTVGAAIGVSGVPALVDHVGRNDLLGRALEYTTTALADQLAAAADLVAGQSDEARPVVRVRGVSLPERRESSVRELLRAPDEDLYA